MHALAIAGDFDDAQARVKDMFNDHAFRDGVGLAGVNSINWARVLAQTVYYFTAAVALGAPHRPVSFTVPTGNFGDIFAGWVAKRMGLPIDRLVIATNQNDILHRTLETGEHRRAGVRPSISPSMDIEVSSNFERLLFELYDREGPAVAALMGELGRGGFALSQGALDRLRAEFDSARASEAETAAAIAETYRATGEVVCPHTAVGLHAAPARRGDPAVPMVVLATAHPAKFPDAVEAACGVRPALPPWMAGPDAPARAGDAGRERSRGDRGRDRQGDGAMTVEVHELANGLRIAVEPMPGLHSAAVGVFLTAGGRHERAEQNGIAHFLEHMAFKGTPTRTALADRRGDRGRRRLHQRLHRQGDDRLLRAGAGGRRAARARHPRRHRAEPAVRGARHRGRARRDPAGDRPGARHAGRHHLRLAAGGRPSPTSRSGGPSSGRPSGWPASAAPTSPASSPSTTGRTG